MFINSLDDFYIHTKNHIDNVVLLADELMEMIRQSKMLKEYYGIDEKYDFDEIKKIVVDGIKLHDQAKVNISEEFLKKYNLDQPMYIDLYGRYGKGRSKEEWAITAPLVQKLNEIDEAVMNEYASQFEPWLKSLILGVESIADKVERGRNPITPEEMGQPAKIASKFLEGQINEYEMAMVKVLEERYFEFCDYRINKKVISKEKYWNFIEENNLEDYIIEDDLSFKIKPEIVKEIIRIDDMVSKDTSYNNVFLDIIKENLQGILKNIQEKSFSIYEENFYEYYNLKIINENDEPVNLDSFKVEKESYIIEDLIKENKVLTFLYDRKSPVFSQKHYQDCINYHSLKELDLKVKDLNDNLDLQYKIMEALIN